MTRTVERRSSKESGGRAGGRIMPAQTLEAGVQDARGLVGVATEDSLAAAFFAEPEFSLKRLAPNCATWSGRAWERSAKRQRMLAAGPCRCRTFPT
jgi:hypothetical protein